MKIEMTVNSERHEVDTHPGRRLLDVLRRDLGLTGSKEGCGEGECGACSVILNGQLVNSCLVAVGQAHGGTVKTVEGLAEAQTVLHPVQDALVQLGGTQCGICTPGIALATAHALEREPQASRERLRELIAGNLCRCTGYQLIIDAAMQAADDLTRERREGVEA